MFLRCSDAEIVRLTGRTLKDVQAKRTELKSTRLNP